MRFVVVGAFLAAHLGAFAWCAYRDWSFEPVLWLTRGMTAAACVFAMHDVYTGMAVGINGRWFAFGLIEGTLFVVTFFPGVLKPIIWLTFATHTLLIAALLLFLIFFRLDRLF